MKTIIVACGTGIATSTVVVSKIKDALAKNGLKANIIQCKISEVPARIDGADLLVTTTTYQTDKVPVMRALSFITGVGMDADLKKIIDFCKED